MSCESIRELLSAHLDSELDADERGRVEAHLAACAACAAEREGLRRTVAIVKGLPRETAPASLAGLVRAALPPAPGALPRAGRAALPSLPRVPAAAGPARARILTLPRVAAAVAAGLLVGVVVRLAHLGMDIRSERDAMELAQGDRAAQAAPPETKSVDRSAENAEKADAKMEGIGETGKSFERKPAANRPVPSDASAAAKQEAVPSDAKGAPDLPMPAMDAALKTRGASRPLAPGVPPPPAAPETPSVPPAPAAPAVVTAAPPTAARKETAKAAPRPAEPAAAPAAAPAPDPAGTADAMAKGEALPRQAGAKDRLGAADAGPAPVAVLAVRSVDPARQAAILDQMAYGEPAPVADKALREKEPETAQAPAIPLGGGAAEGQAESRRAVGGRTARPIVVRVYDLEPARAARFMAALAARTDLRVSVESSDAVAMAGEPTGNEMREALKRLEGRLEEKASLAMDREERGDAIRKLANGADAAPATRSQTFAGGTPAEAAPQAKPGATAGPGTPPGGIAGPAPAAAAPLAPSEPPTPAKPGTSTLVRIVVRLLAE